MERVRASVDEGALVRQASYLPGPYLTVREAAAWTGLHPVTIRRMARAGTLDAVKFGRGTGKNAHWRIPLSRLVPSEPYVHLLMVGNGMRRRLTSRLSELARKSEISDADHTESAVLFGEWYRLVVEGRAAVGQMNVVPEE